MNTELLSATLRLSTPLLLAALGGLICETAGVVNIALEGMMLVGAWGAAVGTLSTHSPMLGLMLGMVMASLTAALYGVCVLHLRANQIVAGMAINMLALGLTPVLCKILYDVTGSTPAIPLNQRFQNGPVLAAYALVFVVWFVRARTRFGLRLVFAGENPEALETAGPQVIRIRWIAVLVSGAFAGMAGASLSIYLSSFFSRNMTAGRGFIALAALIFGKWRPIPTATACLLFAFAEAAQIRLQGMKIGSLPVPIQLIQILPYVVTIVVLAGFVGRARAPKALGGRI
jgi:simple sugar transport system permease protein